jgi:hypothetical protein
MPKGMTSSCSPSDESDTENGDIGLRPADKWPPIKSAQRNLEGEEELSNISEGVRHEDMLCGRVESVKEGCSANCCSCRGMFNDCVDSR